MSHAFSSHRGDGWTLDSRLSRVSYELSLDRRGETTRVYNIAD